MTGLPRLLPPSPGLPTDHQAHVARFGAVPTIDRRSAPAVVAEVERAGLRGLGGARFPTAAKLAAVQGGRHPAVIVNATEGEPASRKDHVLATLAPHLILDGAILAAEVVGATHVYVCIDRYAQAPLAAMTAAVAARPTGGPSVSVLATPGHYVVGEATALTHWVNGGDARPVWGVRPDQRGVANRPTLVQNAETLANLALIVRHGAAWFRSLGTVDEPGSILVTVTGDVTTPGVIEVAIGTDVRAVIEQAGLRARPQALLFGGYGGQWVSAEQAVTLAFSNESLRTAGAALGAGVVAVLGEHRCGLAETARLARWFADESAGQCGPCRFGLPAVAGVLEDLMVGRATTEDLRNLWRWLPEIEGRGACGHPDLAVRMVGSALRVFGTDLERHAVGRPCAGVSVEALLPTPDRRAEPWQ